MRDNAVRRLYRGETHVNFAGRWRRWFAISGTIILIGLISLGVKGLNFSIDFKGGTTWQVPTSASVTQTRQVVSKVAPSLASQALIQVQTNTETNQRVIQVQAGTQAASNNEQLITRLRQALATMAHTNPNNVAVESVGAAWGAQITDKAIKAVIIFLVAVSLYIWLRFEGKMAVAALVALIHDILVTVGIYSLSGFQVSPDTVIAFLTILGYSLYDTIVVFDKVQENTKSLASSNRQTYTDMVNVSMNQVLARSLNTSFVAIIPILSILVIGAGLLGASTLQDFGLALFIGLTTGAYSSIFIASPLLGILKEREPRYREIRRRIANLSGAKLTPALSGVGAGGGGGGANRRSARRPSPAGGGGVAESGVSGSDTARRGATANPSTNGGVGPGPADPEVLPVRTDQDRPPPKARPESLGPEAPAPPQPSTPLIQPTVVPPRSTNRPPPRPRKKTRRR
jgi:preprotein translocase subunit SecF